MGALFQLLMTRILHGRCRMDRIQRNAPSLLKLFGERAFENGRLPAADAGFQSIGMLLVNELEREALFQIADNAGEHLAECDLGL